MARTNLSTSLLGQSPAANPEVAAPGVGAQAPKGLRPAREDAQPTGGLSTRPPGAAEPSGRTASVSTAQALAVPIARLAQMQSLPAVQTLLPPVLFPFTWHVEDTSWWSQTRYHLGSSFALVQCNALILPMQRTTGLLNLPTAGGFCVHAGLYAKSGGADYHAVAEAKLEAAQLVSGPSSATLLLWHKGALTALHLRNDRPGEPWEASEVTVPHAGADEAYLLPRPGRTALGVQGSGASARLIVGTPLPEGS